LATEVRYPKGQVFLDNDGNPAASGTVEWFEAGTTTNQAVYADKDENTVLPNPLTLNSAGRAVDGSNNLVAVYFSDTPGQDYKEVFKLASGATIYTDDDIPKPVDPAAGLSDFAKPLTAWSTDTASTVNLATSNLGSGRLADTSSNSITYNLPSASAAGNGKSITIKKTSASNTVTVDPDSTETIDGQSTYSFDGQAEAWIYSDGANWRVLLRPTVGPQTIFVPASAMLPATTSGPSSAQIEESTNDQNYVVLNFDASADEYAHFQIAFPKGWDDGTISFQAFWSTSATDTDGVAWGLQAVAVSDGDAADASWGTAVVVTDDAQSAANDVLVTSHSSAVTIAGSPAEGDLVFFRVFRDVSDANDDMTEDARLIGIKIIYTTDAATDD